MWNACFFSGYEILLFFPSRVITRRGRRQLVITPEPCRASPRMMTMMTMLTAMVLGGGVLTAVRLGTPASGKLPPPFLLISPRHCLLCLLNCCECSPATALMSTRVAPPEQLRAVRVSGPAYHLRRQNSPISISPGVQAWLLKPPVAITRQV